MGDHYVPKFYLKAFVETQKSDQIWVYEKGKTEGFKTNIKNIAQETGFYTPELEKYLANEIENPANQVLRKIREGHDISQDEKRIFSNYLIIMLKRVPKHKEWINKKAPGQMDKVFIDLEQQLENLLVENPQKADAIEKLRSELFDLKLNKQDELIHNAWLSNISSEYTQESVKLLESMIWCFWICEDYFFLTSDYPLYFFHWMGIRNLKSEVSFPISNNICLWATWNKDFINGHFMKARRQVVKEMNRRTIRNSDRYIYCCSPGDWISKLMGKRKIHLNRIT